MNENTSVKPAIKKKPAFDINKIKEYKEKLKAHKKGLVLFNGIILVLTLLILLFVVKPYYKSSITILPDFGDKTSFGRFGDLASLVGVNVGEGPSTEIYQNLITSEVILEPVISQRYKTEEFELPVNLIDYFEIETDSDYSEEDKLRDKFLKTYKNLNNRTESSFNTKTKILIFNVFMPESKLSSDVANSIAFNLDRYLRTKIKTKATEQRKYLEKRLINVKDSLNRFENELKMFREQNRIILSSPQLLLEQSRLLRNVEISQIVYTELVKQLELIKIDEVKDIPVLNIREVAQNPIRKDGPKRLYILITTIILALLLSVIYILNKEKIIRIYLLLKS